ncbi:hypothetical protein NPIL_177591 [Nephila pilipes]|uniref:Uncharacterized protein n=1 Tax=Nephila pilipes TaxID=299642 RepID=A0A8X6NWD3_NEPPI|nr:hypothetical protein NPIL_177591 [Nephila pilipes]
MKSADGDKIRRLKERNDKLNSARHLKIFTCCQPAPAYIQYATCCHGSHVRQRYGSSNVAEAAIQQRMHRRGTGTAMKYKEQQKTRRNSKSMAAASLHHVATVQRTKRVVVHAWYSWYAYATPAPARVAEAHHAGKARAIYAPRQW